MPRCYGLRWILCSAVACLLVAPLAHAWGSNGHKLITNKAVDTLPPEIRSFFEANRGVMAQHSVEPLDWLAKTPLREQRNQVIFLDRYGRFPFDRLPRSYNEAVKLHTKRKIEANGLLPWQIGVYSEKLTEAFKSRNWEEARLYAGVLAFYVAAAHDPFNTTENFDGVLSGQKNVQLRFGTLMLDRYSQFFFLRPNDASFVADPTDRAFEICLSAHSWLENIQLADLRAHRDLNAYGDEYYDRFYNQAGAILVRQVSDAASNVGSFWLTAWMNAGRPQLPSR